MKRFYKNASVAPGADGFAVLLDGKPVRTPARNELSLPSRALAGAVAAEWQAQGDTVQAATMPLLRLANTVIDGVAPGRDAVIDAILRFGENDLLCYRAHQPPDLHRRQAKGWDPLLDWARQRWGADLRLADGITHVDQPPQALAALRGVVAGYDPFMLGGLHVVASITGSLVLGLAVAQGYISGARAFELSRIDEAYQAEKWGADAEAVKRTAALARELDKAVELMALARADA